MALDISMIIILATLFIIFGVFLLFDLFKRNEKYGYFAYIVAVIPVNYFWAAGYDPLLAYLILFILWIITLLRDTIGVYLKKNKEINEILLYLTLAILIQFIFFSGFISPPYYISKYIHLRFSAFLNLSI